MALDYILSEIKYQLINLVIRNRVLLDRWKKGISIMVEKSHNNISIIKLHTILLLETDFNALNKIVFNTHLIPSLEYKESIPHEIIGGR